ncbi:MAG: MIP/aquaporin family protein [Gemmatimonadaceae bacterium]
MRITYVTEFVGTFFLVLTIGLVVASGSALAPLAIGSALMIMVYMGGHVSGAHYNPAVTLAVWMRGKLPARDVAPYMISQLLGAIAAALTSHFITGTTFAPAPGPTATIPQALLIEVLFTFALALVVLNVATSRKTENNSFYGLAIGFTVLTGAFVGGSVSGGAFNPAVGVGPALANMILGSGSLSQSWIYLVGPFAGAVVAALLFRAQNPEDTEQAIPAPPAQESLT